MDGGACWVGSWEGIEIQHLGYTVDREPWTTMQRERVHLQEYIGVHRYVQRRPWSTYSDQTCHVPATKQSTRNTGLKMGIVGSLNWARPIENKTNG